MNSSNPFSIMMNMTRQSGPGIGTMPRNPMAQMMNNMMPSGNMSINQNQFRQYLSNIDDNMLSQLAQKARQQGIAENDIQSGLNFIKQLKQSSF